jgi:hypothetical protein
LSGAAGGDGWAAGLACQAATQGSAATAGKEIDIATIKASLFTSTSLPHWAYGLGGLLPAKGRSDFAELFAPAGPLKTDKNTLYLVALTVPGGRASWRPPGLDLAAIADVAVELRPS